MSGILKVIMEHLTLVKDISVELIPLEEMVTIANQYETSHHFLDQLESHKGGGELQTHN